MTVLRTAMVEELLLPAPRLQPTRLNTSALTEFRQSVAPNG